MINKLRLNNEFSRNVLTLMTGTALAQAIPIAISPILTRIYTPADFGVFALYSAIVSTIGIIATGRYELAIMLPKEDSDAANIVVLSLLIAFIMSILTLVIVIIFNANIVKLLGETSISKWLYLMPLSLLFTGIFQSLNYWCNRNKNYKTIATRSVLQSSVSATIQVASGVFSLPSNGLISGSISGQVFGVFSMLKTTWYYFKKQYSSICYERLIDNAVKYRKFPLLSSFGAFANTSASYAPIYLMTNFFGATVTGFYGMASKTINTPMTLISGSISQVLFQHISSVHNNDPKLLTKIVIKMFFILILIASPMVIILALFGTELFSFVFGENWAEAGRYAGILSISVAIKFAVSPLSSVLVLEHNIRKGVMWQTAYFISVFITLFVASKLEIEYYLMVYVLHDVVLYSIYLFIILKATKYRSLEREVAV